MLISKVGYLTWNLLSLSRPEHLNQSKIIDVTEFAEFKKNKFKVEIYKIFV